MGWGRTFLLGDIGNRLDIGDVERDVHDLKQGVVKAYKKNLSQDERLDQLAAEVAELRLYLAASLRLLTARGAITAEELRALVNAVDGEDGLPDGKYTGELV
jgi:hypothetical protein